MRHGLLIYRHNWKSRHVNDYYNKNWQSIIKCDKKVEVRNRVNNVKTTGMRDEISHNEEISLSWLVAWSFI